jgi:hypothetical protein
MTWFFVAVAVAASVAAGVTWRRMVGWRTRMSQALANAQRLGLVSCIRCGAVDEPVVVSGEDDARVACRHCHGFALEPVDSISEERRSR